ncbi:DinB family protein [Algoriphagus sanaruensis]|uniref:Damage-inducible protein DinB n=1 Tax=Algoriphagus sanaruensis TaxID=1727163 RepID=A0A142EJZ7_9BACT|nr:DinB family protein [Algoriphagus sanaruensis]AMQ55452.1 damage-inducible protein DinB [Algoriphagus sanaruensis]
MTNALFIQLWKEGRTRFEKLLPQILEKDLSKRLGSSPNSAGFLIRHVAEVELLFAKNVFGLSEVKVSAKTLIAGKDTGEWTDLEELVQLCSLSKELLERAIAGQTNWEEVVVTKEFGSKTRAEALGRITTHTAYHAGQLALILKYGV